MPDENVKTAQEIIEEAKKAPKTPQLSEEFFQELLNLPACKRFGYCDDCGRCERLLKTKDIPGIIKVPGMFIFLHCSPPMWYTVSQIHFDLF